MPLLLAAKAQFVGQVGIEKPLIPPTVTCCPDSKLMPNLRKNIQLPVGGQEEQKKNQNSKKERKKKRKKKI